MNLNIQIPDNLAKKLRKIPNADSFVIDAIKTAFKNAENEKEWGRLVSSPESQKWLDKQSDIVMREYRAGGSVKINLRI